VSVIVLGSGPQALYVLRILSREGKKVLLISLEKKIAFESKYGEKKCIPDPEVLITELERLAFEFDELHICGGKELQAIVDYGQGLFSCYEIFPKPANLLSIFSKKNETYTFFSGIGIRYPNQYEPDSLLHKNNLPGPILVKWNQDILHSVIDFKFKTKIFDDFREYLFFYNQISSETLKYLIIQDYIAGREDSNISLQLSLSSDNVSYLFTRKCRVSKNGYGSYVEEFTPNADFMSDIYSPIVSLLQHSCYEGLIEIEFKQCEVTGIYFLIEANSRPCGLLSAFGSKVKSPIRLLYGNSVQEERLNVQVRWSSILRDLQACVLLFLKNKSLYIFGKNILSIFRSNSIDIFDIRDLKPFFMQVKK
jgi:predicted ATP-grasp superfamily ATP-dependent carboligase